MRQKITILIAFTLTLGLYAQNIEFTFANHEITTDGGTFYEVDVMIATVESQTDFILGKGQVYINYDTAIFGTFINGSSGIEISYPVSDGYILGAELFAGFPYYSTAGTGISDNSDSRFSFAYQQAVSSGTIGSNNVTTAPTRLFHIKMLVTGTLPSVSYTPIEFEDDETEVANCRDQFETACGPASGAADCAGFPGVVFNDALFDSTGAEVLSVEQNDITEIQIYPNPVSDVIYLEGVLDDVSSIDLFSITGQLVKQIERDFSTINVKSIENGVYFLKINAQDKQRIFKFIKE